MNDTMQFSTFHLFTRPEGMSAREVYARELELACFVEECGFDAVWIAEHHFRDYGICPNTMTVLAALAAKTTRIRLGSAVTVLPLHDPVRFAEEAAAVDILSGGRLNLGVGRGYQGVEFDKFGVPLSEARARFDEYLDIVLGAWQDGPLSYDGTYRTVRETNINPKPVQRPHPPLWVAAVSPETVEMYARRGLPILADPSSTFSRVKNAAVTWEATARDAGFDPSASELGIMRFVHVAKTLEQARSDLEEFDRRSDISRYVNKESAPVDIRTGRIAEGFEYWEKRYLKGASVGTEFRWEQQELAGDPDRLVEQIQTLRDFGYRHLMCDFGNTRRLALDEMKRTIKLFADEVIPAFR